MAYRVYCLYASLKGADPEPWMIAAEDECSWEGDPERCNAVFKAARDMAERNDFDVREVTLVVDLDAICRAFEATEVEAVTE